MDGMCGVQMRAPSSTKSPGGRSPERRTGPSLCSAAPAQPCAMRHLKTIEGQVITRDFYLYAKSAFFQVEWKELKRYAPVARKRAVRLMFDQQGQHSSQWAAIPSIANMVGCTAETLRRWVRQSETDQSWRNKGRRNKRPTGSPGCLSRVGIRGPRSDRANDCKNKDDSEECVRQC
jgi:hypothetical protein